MPVAAHSIIVKNWQKSFALCEVVRQDNTEHCAV